MQPVQITNKLNGGVGAEALPPSKAYITQGTQDDGMSDKENGFSGSSSESESPKMSRSTGKKKQEDVLGKLLTLPDGNKSWMCYGKNYGVAMDRNIILHSNGGMNSGKSRQHRTICILNNFLKELFTPLDEGPSIFADEVGVKVLVRGKVIEFTDGMTLEQSVHGYDFRPDTDSVEAALAEAARQQQEQQRPSGKPWSLPSEPNKAQLLRKQLHGVQGRGNVKDDAFEVDAFAIGRRGKPTFVPFNSAAPRNYRTTFIFDASNLCRVFVGCNAGCTGSKPIPYFEVVWLLIASLRMHDSGVKVYVVLHPTWEWAEEYGHGFPTLSRRSQAALLWLASEGLIRWSRKNVDDDEKVIAVCREENEDEHNVARIITNDNYGKQIAEKILSETEKEKWVVNYHFKKGKHNGKLDNRILWQGDKLITIHWDDADFLLFDEVVTKRFNDTLGKLKAKRTS